IDGQTIKDPVTFYLDKEGNEDAIYLASVLRWGGDTGFPPEPIGGWPETPPVKPGIVNWPTISRQISSYFGIRCDPIEMLKTGKCILKHHNGIDIGVSYEPVYAAAAGTVVYSGSVGGYGNIIIIRHDDLRTISTAYAHLFRSYVNLGARVVAGQLIATSGNTGYSTGPHLHFEVRNGLAEDLRSYLLLQPLNPLDCLSR
ncbi:unnamed protein product, partial [marine sediment metagenome]